MLKEKRGIAIPGYLMLLLIIALFTFIGWVILRETQTGFLAEYPEYALLLAIPVFFLLAFSIMGFVIVEPSEAVVLQFLGNYAGTVHTSGLRWILPFYAQTRVSKRVYNFETSKMRITDADGTPMEVGCVVAWRVSNAAMALLEVENYEQYVRTQCEGALREVVASFSYLALSTQSSNAAESAAEKLRAELAKRFHQAGVELYECRINHLTYGAEIAGAMMQRQQAQLLIQARQMMAESSVEMVEIILRRLSKSDVVQLDENQKIHLLSRLLVAFCSNNGVQQTIDV